MGLFDTQPQNSMDRGRFALKFFVNQCAKYGSTLTMDQVIDSLGADASSRATVLGKIGEASANLHLTDDQIEQAMEGFADSLQGKLPDRASKFILAFNKIGDQMLAEIKKDAEPNAIERVILDVANDVNKVTGDVAGAVGGTFQAVKWIVIPAAILGVVFILYGRSRMLAGR